jgi:hypothetical protein
VYDVAQVNQHLSEYSTTFRLTTYNNSLLGKDAVSLKEKITCVDEHQKDVGLGHTTYTPAIKIVIPKIESKPLKMAGKSFQKHFTQYLTQRILRRNAICEEMMAAACHLCRHTLTIKSNHTTLV